MMLQIATGISSSGKPIDAIEGLLCERENQNACGRCRHQGDDITEVTRAHHRDNALAPELERIRAEDQFRIIV
jgi:hypothetical protein